MSWQDKIRDIGKLPKKAAVKPVLDSCDDKEKPIFDEASNHTMNDISLKAIGTLQQWVESDDLDEGESMADRLLAMVVGIADANKDGEITEDEQGVVDIALNAIWDYLSQYGVEDSDIGALLEDWDADAAVRIRDLLASSLPEGDGADADIDNFVFGSDQDPVLDAAYKKTVVVRHGKKVRINKRISGTVKLSAKQKLAIRKAVMKSHSAVAQMHRTKSMHVRSKAGL